MSNRKAKLACATALFAAILVTLPAFLLFGQSSVTIETEYGTVCGFSCAVNDAYKNENYLVGFNIFIVSLAFMAFLTHMILYSSIAKALWTSSTDKTKRQAVKPLEIARCREIAQIPLSNLVKRPEHQNIKTENETSEIEEDEVMRAKRDATLNKKHGDLSASNDQTTQNEILISLKSQFSITFKNKTSFSIITKPEMECIENRRENKKETNNFKPINLSEVEDNRLYENVNPETDKNGCGLFLETSVDSTQMMNDCKEENPRPIVALVNPNPRPIVALVNPNPRPKVASVKPNPRPKVASVKPNPRPKVASENSIVASNMKCTVGSLHQSGPLNQNGLLRRKRMLTLIFFFMVAIFFLSYIPHLAIKIIKHARPDVFQRLSRNGIVAFNTIIWVLYVHYTANPLVLIFLDRKFRVELMSFYKKLFCCK